MKKVILILLVLLCFNFVAAEQYEIGSAEICLNESIKISENLKNNNFSVERVNDMINEMRISLNGQKTLADQGRQYDVSNVISKCAEIVDIEELAFASKDSLFVLKGFYDEISADINLSEVIPMIVEIENEIMNERYEKVDDMVDEAYDEIIDIRAKSSTLNVFYDVASRSIKNFFINNWRYLLYTFLGLLFTFLIFRRMIKSFLLQRKLKNLELRKESLKGLLMKNQDDYFNKNSISDSIYHIKNKKLAELIRDIDRQVPLIYEKMEKNKK